MKTIKLFLLFSVICHLTCDICFSQNKSGNSWVFGINGQIANFAGDTSRPTTKQLFYSGQSPNYPYAFTLGSSSLCDSATGDLLLLCNGMQLFDTLGNIVENGDTLVPIKMYLKNAYPNAPFSQGSIILPKGNNGQYYVIIPTVTDSVYDAYWTNNNGKYPYNEILVHTVDMNANGGLGKVIDKNKIILNNVDLAPTMMQACRHSNGVDWWLLKQGLDSNIVYRFLVTKDSIYGAFIQKFSQPNWGYYVSTGQSSFSKDGKKYALIHGKSNKLFMADFDRCTGELSNPKIYTIPIDSSGTPQLDVNGYRDSLVCGGCFSPNGNYFYVTRRYNIYQFEYNEPDSSLAWYHVKQGMDTSWGNFEYYGSLQLGVDNRIYIGKGGGGFKQLSVIDKPDEKGIACSFCRKCLRIDNGAGGSTAPANIPDFNLGADLSKPCYPLDSQQFAIGNEQLEVFPNPASTILEVRGSMKGSRKELYNSVGQLIISTKENEINVSKLSSGLYYLRVENQTKKLIVE